MDSDDIGLWRLWLFLALLAALFLLAIAVVAFILPRRAPAKAPTKGV